MRQYRLDALWLHLYTLKITKAVSSCQKSMVGNELNYRDSAMRFLKVGKGAIVYMLMIAVVIYISLWIHQNLQNYKRTNKWILLKVFKYVNIFRNYTQYKDGIITNWVSTITQQANSPPYGLHISHGHQFMSQLHFFWSTSLLPFWERAEDGPSLWAPALWRQPWKKLKLPASFQLIPDCCVHLGIEPLDGRTFLSPLFSVNQPFK